MEEVVTNEFVVPEELENIEPVEKELSEHIIMQWKLATRQKSGVKGMGATQ